MTIPERRYTHRFGLKVPMVFCPVHSPLANGHHTKSINISSRGVYFVTSHPVFVGLPVQVRLRMPGGSQEHYRAKESSTAGSHTWNAKTFREEVRELAWRFSTGKVLRRGSSRSCANEHGRKR